MLKAGSKFRLGYIRSAASQAYGLHAVQSGSHALLLSFVLVFALLVSFSSPSYANDTLETANTALIQGKHKDVVKLVGQVISKGKQPPAVMAKALLLRGIAYRNQGKVAQAIADFSNAEWLQKLSGVELRRLYAERALAYETAGQKALAAKDRRLAGSNSIEAAKRIENGTVGQGVKVTSITEAPSTTTEFFGGLGNLFGFGNQKKQAEIKTKVVAKKADTTLREIPTLDSAESKANRAKLEGREVPDAAIEAAKVKVDSKPSNSAWVGRKKEGAPETAKTTGKPEVLPWQVASNDKNAAINNPAAKLSAAPQGPVNTEGPVVLTPAKVKEESSGNSVTSFFTNIFTGSPEKKAEAPVTPGDDVISADQVASIEATKKAPPPKKRAVKPVKKPARKVAARTPPAKKPVAQNTGGRSLYHLQLGVFGEAQAADRFVSRLNKKFGPVVGSKTAMVVETDLGQSRRQYRVYLGPFRSRDKGLKSCKTLTKLGMGCRLVE